ncbi:hypothetical protein [Clostridium cuniculi]|uniref:hypothetical protein n=1 Tax=Clostridium cuniculi TaxID=2548455 RepID=UPI001056D32A|nr:hypothetical protein [Clostridium cuniculi]
MKKSIYFISIFSLMIMLYVSDQKNKKLENMTTQYTDNYVSIIWEDRTYIPFCAIDNSEKGIQIGIVNGDKNDRVYEYRAHSTDEWIISFYKSGEMDNSMLMKEINVTEIPDNLQSDYK